jgi:hypothetical protein
MPEIPGNRCTGWRPVDRFSDNGIAQCRTKDVGKNRQKTTKMWLCDGNWMNS